MKLGMLEGGWKVVVDENVRGWRVVMGGNVRWRFEGGGRREFLREVRR